MWFKKQGFKENPFDWRPNKEVLIGVTEEKQNLLNFITSGDLCLLTGETGTGKTSLAQHFITSKPQGYTYHRIDCRAIDVDFTLKNELKKLKRFKILPPKNVVLFLDEFQHAPDKLVEKIVAYCEAKKIKSVIAIQINRDLNIPGNVQDKMGYTRVVEMKKLDMDDCKELIRQRLKGKKIFADETLTAVIERSKFIPRRILELSERLCINYQKSEPITIKDLNDLEDLQQVSPTPKKEIKQTSNKKAKIKGSNELAGGVKLTPLQANIISSLFRSEKSTKEISEDINKPLKSISKQLSLLKKKNIILADENSRPKRFGLELEFKRSWVTE